MRWALSALFFLLCATSASAQVNAGKNHQVLNCFQYGSGLQGNYLCINQGLSSGWFALQGDASMYTGPLCSDNNNSKCGFITVNNLSFGGTSIPLSPTPPTLGQCLVETVLGIGGVACGGAASINPYAGGVQITANSGTGTDFINGLAQVMHTYYVDGFGAVGDGATDDAVAVQNASVAACSAGGGIVKFSPGKTYFLNTKLSNSACGPPLIDYPCSNLYFDARGATMSQTNNNVFACLGNRHAAPESLTHSCPITAGATVGSNTITITTGGSCTTPSAGDPVVIQPNPFVSYFLLEINYVASITGSTITLLNPIGKTITPNPVVADVSSAGWVHNIGWFGGTINTNARYVFNGFAHDTAIVKDVTINDTSPNNGNIISAVDMYGDVFDGDTLNLTCANGYNFGSRGSQAMKVTNGVVNETGGTTGCASSTGNLIYMALAGESSIDITFDHNTFSDSTGQGVIGINPGGGGSFSQDTKFINNSVYFAPPISTFPTHIPVEFNTANTIVSGNNFTRALGTSFYNFIVNRGDSMFTNNIIEDFGTSGITLQCGPNGICNNNKIFTNTAGPTGLNMSVGAIATGNYIFGPGSGTGISINDPGAPSSIPVVATGNVLQNWGTNVSFGNIANVLYPQVFNNGASGLNYMLNPADANDALVAPGIPRVNIGNLGTGGVASNPTLNIHSDAGGGNNTNFQITYTSAGVWSVTANSNQTENSLGTWTMQMNTNPGGAVTFINTASGGGANNRLLIGSGGTITSQGAFSVQGVADANAREQLVAGAGICTGPGTTACVNRINESGILTTGPFLFANRAANLSANGMEGFCTDCKNVVTDAVVSGAACVNGGTGAKAIRISAGVFQCN